MAKKKYIETPGKMWQLFVDYRAKVKSNPRTKVEYVGKDGERVETPLVTPLTMEGFENYVADENLNQELGHYFSNLDERYTLYVPICSRVKRSIRQDQIEGGMVGQYNASITQRLNGLSDKQEVKQETTIRDLTIEIVDTNVPLAGAEKDIEE